MHRLRLLLCVCIAALCTVVLSAQQSLPSAIKVQGLRSVNHQGAFRAVAYLPDGNIVALFDGGDGVRILEADPTLARVLGETHLGAAGDSGIALAVTSSGEIYVGGTSSSGALPGTTGAAFRSASDASLNSFLARFDPALNLVSLTFLGAGKTELTGLAVTADAVFATGLTYSTALPTTPGVLMPAPAANSSGNGFVERFSPDLASLRYATYLTAPGGATTLTAIAADAADDVLIAGGTSSAQFPTVAALQPTMPGETSGLLCKLGSAGDRFLFSTFIAGQGLTSLALDNANGTILATGNLSFRQFPIANVSSPVVATAYQSLLRLSADGQNIEDSVLLFAGDTSYVTPGPNGTAWITGSLALPLTQQQASTGEGDSIAMFLDAADVIQGAVRLGGRPISHPTYASLASRVGAAALNPGATAVLIPSAISATTDPSFVASQTFDFPAVGPRSSLLPGTAADLLPSSCLPGQTCGGSAGGLMLLGAPAGDASLGLITGDLPNITVRNLGDISVTGLSLAAPGLGLLSSCPSTLVAHTQCGARLTNSGTGTLQVSASNASALSQPLVSPATTSSEPLGVSMREIDFGPVSLEDPPVAQTVQITNLSDSPQTFASAAFGVPSAAPYSLTEAGSTCAGSPAAHTLLAQSSCSVTLQLATASGAASNSPIQAGWLFGSQAIGVTGFAQLSALSVSTSAIDFGQQSSGSSGLPRFLYLSNVSRYAQAHAPVSAPPGSPFTVNDDCPTTLEPYSVCQIGLSYHPGAAPAFDTLTLTLDAGLTVVVTGETRPAASNQELLPTSPLLVSPSAVQFSTPIFVSQVSADATIVQVTNGGTAPVPVSASVLGPFQLEAHCTAPLAPGASCDIDLRFAPTVPGVQEGVLQLSAGGEFADTTVPLTGTATPLLGSSTTVDLGQTSVGEPVTVWYQIPSLLPSLTVAATGSGFGVALLADNGGGHGTLPASAFASTASAPCLRCWVAVQFFPQDAGPASGTLTLGTDPQGQPLVVALRALSVSTQGLLLPPSAPGFGSVPVHSTSSPVTLTLTNLLPAPVAITVQHITVEGDFQTVPSTSPLDCTFAALQPAASCRIQLQFTPTGTGARAGRVTVQTSAGSVTADLSGIGTSDPGLSLSPVSVVLDSTGPTVVTLKNTGSITLQIGSVLSNDSALAATSQCGSLTPGQSCTASVRSKQASVAENAAVLFPVTAADDFGQSTVTTYAVPVTTSASSSASLAAFPFQTDFGVSKTGSLGPIRDITVLNNSAMTISLTVSPSRNFPLIAPSACDALAPGKTCTVALAFLPEVASPLDGTLTLLATGQDGTAQGSATVYLHGYGLGSAALALSNGQQPDAPVSFSQVATGQIASQSITVTNTGASPLRINEIATTAPFRASSPCPPSLNPGTSCAVSLSYTPSAAVAADTGQAPQTEMGTLTLQTDAATSADTVYLTGTVASATTASGLPSALPTYTLSASAVSVFGAGSSHTLSIANNGTVPVDFNAFTAPADFTATSDCTALQPGKTCSLTVAFSPAGPASTSPRSGVLRIASDAANSLEFVSLLAAPSPVPLQVSVQQLDFGSVVVGASTSLSLTLTNANSLPVVISTLAASAPFNVGASDCPAAGGTLAAGQTCTLSLTFAPDVAGTASGTLTIGSPELPEAIVVALHGIGIAGHLQVSPSALDFGTVQLLASATKTVSLTNAGTADLTDLHVVLSGSSANSFAVTSSCPETLPVGASCGVSVSFRPAEAGSQTAQLTLSSSDPNGPSLVTLTGSGTLPPGFTLTVAGATAETLTVSSGSPAAFALTITAQGGYADPVALTCIPVAAAPNGSCSLSRTGMTLSAVPAKATATINTRSKTAVAALGILGWLSLLPLTFSAAYANRRFRMVRPLAALLLLLVFGLANLGCSGGYGLASPNAPPGTYVYRVTASSVTGTPISSSVTLTVIVP